MHIWTLFRNPQPHFDTEGGAGAGAGSGGAPGDVSELDRDLADLGGDGDDEGEEEEGEESPDEDEGEDEDEGDEGEGEEDEGEESDEEDDEGDEDENEEEEGTETEEEKAARLAAEAAKPKIEGRPTFAQLKKEFPDLVKQVPGIRDIMFREANFSKHFSDPEQAADAAVKAGFYEDLEASLVGETSPDLLFKELSQNNPNAFKLLSANLLPGLRKVDNNLYIEAVTPAIEELLYHALKRGETTNNKNLINSAKHIADFFQGSPEIKDITKRADKHPAEIELEKEREKTDQREQGRALQNVNGRIDRSLRGMIVEDLPKDMTAFVKNAVTEKILDKILETASKDSAFGLKQRQLWRKARVAGYSEQTLASIHSAHVARARSVIREIKAEVLKEAGVKAKKKLARQANQQQPRKRQFDTGGQPGGPSRRAPVLDSSKIDYRSTSDLDILNDNGGDRIKLKGRSK